MMEDDSHRLLLRFSRDRSNEAIHALILRHSPLVFATALRRLNGDHYAAQDVTQEVFALLVKKASSLQGVFLSGWLHRQACRKAANHVRTEQRRKHREKIAVESLESSTPAGSSPFLFRELDEALLKLPSLDRDAVILRFFQGRDYRHVGRELGISEEAARKRVKRSLEHLAEILKTRGVVLTGGSLEATLLGWEAPPVPSAIIQKVTENALVGITGKSAGGAILKSILVGSIVASIAAGGTLAMQNRKNTEPKPIPASTAHERNERRNATFSTLPAGSSLESIIAEIKRLQSGPTHTLTDLQMQALLATVDVAHIPEFIALAEEKLSPSEQFATYEPLLKRWSAQAPADAMTFVLQSGIASRRDGAIWGNTLLGNLFDSWLERSRDAPAAWFTAHQNDPFLKAGGEGAPLSGKITMQYYQRGNHAAVFRFMDTLHSTEAKMTAFHGITGEGSLWMMAKNGRPERWINFHRVLQNHAPPELKNELSLHFWRNLAQRQYDDLRATMEAMEPIERFHASLGLVAAAFVPRPASDGPGKGVKNVPVEDRDARVAAVLQASQDAGISDTQTIMMLGEALSFSLDDAAFSEWISQYPEFDPDPSILRRMQRELKNPGEHIHDPREAIHLRWAVMLREPQRRRSAARGAFLRLLAAKPDLTTKSLATAPEDIAEELRTLMPPTP